MLIKEYVINQKQKLKADVAALPRAPRFSIVQVNQDPASDVYIRGKINDANEVGIEARLIKLQPTITEEYLFEVIEQLNHDPFVDGFIVQMPLPKHISEQAVKEAIAPAKDIDGFHPMSKFNPCTPQGIINYLKSENINFTGKNAVVIGRSNIVGKPMQRLLLNENCNVVQLHSKTTATDMAFYVAHADIIVVAVGKKYMLNRSFTFKPTAVIVDVGLNREDGISYGDVEPNLPVQLQTPVPGGVGLLTRLTLLENVLEAAKNGI